MVFRKVLMLAVGILALSAGDVAFSITCDECRELQKQRSDVQVELARKERELDLAVNRKDFRKISNLRADVNQLRSRMLNMRGRDEECAVACRPDVIREAECLKLMEEIVALESGTSEGAAKDGSKESKEASSGGEAAKTAEPSGSAPSVAKIDNLYKDLARCHRELKRLKEIHKR